MKKVLLLTLIVIGAFTAKAQIDPSMGTPPQPGEYGKCYAKCWMPDKYDYVEERVQISGGETTTKIIPAKYSTITERVLVKEASQKYVPVPAVYETQTKKVLVKEGNCKINYSPAQYQTKTTQKLVKEATGTWERKLKAPNCLSSNPDDCYILCWVEVPAIYEYDVEMVQIEAERYDTTYIDEVYSTISVQVLKTPATYRVEEIPAQYNTVTIQKLEQCEGLETFTNDAKYKTNKRKVLIEPGGYTDWVEVVCDVDIDVNMISSVQNKLNALGYNAGTADGIMGTKTKVALEQFQKDNGLPVGNLNISTMEALGIK